MKMNSSVKFFKQPLVHIWQNYKHDGGKMLLHLGAIGWIVSSIAQIGAIAINKKIKADEKKFLIPQEAMDGIVNAGFYYLLTDTCLNIGNKLVESGKITTLHMKKYILSDIFKVKSTDIPLTSLSEKILKGSKTITKTLENHLKNASNLKILEKNMNEFLKFKNAIGLITSIGASVVACNIVTPFIRNAIAAKMQKAALEKEKKLPQNPYPPTIIPSVEVDVKTRNTFSQFINPYKNCSMKI